MAAGPAAKALALSDGSHIRLSPGARLAPLASSGQAFSVIVAQGRVDFDVQPGGTRRWTIECGLATVEVVGTAFACERQAGRLRVAVSRGVVLVRGERVPDRVQRLVGGQALDIVEDTPGPPVLGSSPPAVVNEAKAGAFAARAAVKAPNPNAVTPSRAPLPPTVALRTDSHTAASPGPVQQWRELARDGRHGEAFAVLGKEGLQQESRRLGVADLLALADVARLSGHPADAVAPLQRILVDYAGDAQAPLAAFALGRLELDSLGRPQAAVEAFERALTLGIPRGLREDARARLVEAHARAGDGAAARAAAEAYAAEFPGGRHGRAIEGWLRAR